MATETASAGGVDWIGGRGLLGGVRSASVESSGYGRILRAEPELEGALGPAFDMRFGCELVVYVETVRRVATNVAPVA